MLYICMLDGQEADVFSQRCTVTLFAADDHLNYLLDCMPGDDTRPDITALVDWA